MKPSPSVVAFGLAGLLALVAVGMQAGRTLPRSRETPLHRAVGAGDVDAVRQLLDAGASTNERTVGGMTALGFAAQSRKWDVASLLLARGGDPNARVYGMSLVRALATSDQKPGADWLLAHGAARR